MGSKEWGWEGRVLRPVSAGLSSGASGTNMLSYLLSSAFAGLIVRSLKLLFCGF